jgi:hypothetical protein
MEMGKIVRVEDALWLPFMSEEFDTMRLMLTDIQEKIKKAPATRQRQFIQPIRDLIFEAWQDAKNPEDDFLYPKK